MGCRTEIISCHEKPMPKALGPWVPPVQRMASFTKETGEYLTLGS